MNTPGNTLLKAASIIFIIFGGIYGFISIFLLLGSGAISNFGYGIASRALLVSSILLLLNCTLNVVIGVIGLKKSKKPRQFNYFIITGMVLCVFSFASMISNFQVATMIGFILPFLYIVGGLMNKRATSM